MNKIIKKYKIRVTLQENLYKDYEVEAEDVFSAKMIVAGKLVKEFPSIRLLSTEMELIKDPEDIAKAMEILGGEKYV